MFDFGLRIRELRQQQKLSQEQLGKKIGRSKPVISSYENNIKIPSLEVLTQMAVIFNVSLDYLVGIDKKEMISVAGLTAQQKHVLNLIVADFKDTSKNAVGLSARQQEILNLLMQDFSAH